MKKILLSCFTISSISLLILICIFLNSISGCGNRSMFVIENQLKESITIDFIYDTLNLKQYAKSLNDTLDINADNDYIFDYIKDSIHISSLIPERLGIGDLKEESYLENQFENSPDFLPRLSKWNSNDSILKNKLFDQSTISIELPPQLALFEYCKTCADCTCMHPIFPSPVNRVHHNQNHITYGSELLKIKVIIHELDYIELTPYNFTRIMKMETIRGQENSAILRIE